MEMRKCVCVCVVVVVVVVVGGGGIILMFSILLNCKY